MFALEARADEPVLVPPKLVESAPAEDPRTGAGPRGVVELELDLDREGKVTEVRVVRAAGEALETAAISAARRSTFTPATRNGEAAPSRVRYESVFEAREAKSPLAAPAKAAVGGSALDARTGSAIAGATVTVTTADGTTLTTTTDARGAFRIDDAPAGVARIILRADGYDARQLDEKLDDGVLTEARVRLEKTRAPDELGATARVDAPPREVTKRVLDRKTLAGVAGTRGDSLRAIELLPGVSRPAPNGGPPILRGANAFDSQVFLDGAPVPILYHIGGLTSFVHSRALESVELQPSNFSPRYGRKMGGIIEVKLRDPRTDGLHGITELSLLDSSVLVETPVTDKLAVLATARRSNIDLIVNSATSDKNFAITAAPVYWDYQSIVAFKPTERDRFRVLAYGSSDRLALVLKKPADIDPSVRGRVANDVTFHRVQLGWRHRWGSGSEQNTEITYGREDGVGAFGKVAGFKYGVDTVQLRSEWTGVVSPAFRIIGGVDLLGNSFRGDYTGVPIPPGEGDHATPLSTQRKISVSLGEWSWMPGVYLEAGIRPIRELLIAPGVRADYSNIVGRGVVDPRLSSRLDVTESTTLKAGVGRFSQIPSEAEVLRPIGNPNLQLPRALHVSGGFEQKLGGASTLAVEGFVKWMDRVTTTTPDGREPFFVNAQRGRIFGGEVFCRFNPEGRLSGFVSYTLMRSERGTDGSAFRLFDRDQTHILAAAGSYKLGRGWELGATLRYTSGTPYTPVASTSFDATNDVYVPRLGRAMSARNPAFSRLDLRVQKTWTFTKWSLAVYLDVQNVLNAENREGFAYSYDYRNRNGVRGLPILPILGIRGEL